MIFRWIERRLEVADHQRNGMRRATAEHFARTTTDVSESVAFWRLIARVLRPVLTVGSIPRHLYQTLKPKKPGDPEPEVLALMSMLRRESALTDLVPWQVDPKARDRVENQDMHTVLRSVQGMIEDALAAGPPPDQPLEPPPLAASLFDRSFMAAPASDRWVLLLVLAVCTALALVMHVSPSPHVSPDQRLYFSLVCFFAGGAITLWIGWSAFASVRVQRDGVTVRRFGVWARHVRFADVEAVLRDKKHLPRDPLTCRVRGRKQPVVLLFPVIDPHGVRRFVIEQLAPHLDALIDVERPFAVRGGLMWIDERGLRIRTADGSERSVARDRMTRAYVEARPPVRGLYWVTVDRRSDSVEPVQDFNLLVRAVDRFLPASGVRTREDAGNLEHREYHTAVTMRRLFVLAALLFAAAALLSLERWTIGGFARIFLANAGALAAVGAIALHMRIRASREVRVAWGDDGRSNAAD